MSEESEVQAGGEHDRQPPPRFLPTCRAVTYAVSEESEVQAGGEHDRQRPVVVFVALELSREHSVGGVKDRLRIG